MENQRAYSLATVIVTSTGILLNSGVVCYNLPKLSSLSAASILTMSTCAADIIVTGDGLIDSLLWLTQDWRRNLETVNNDTTCHVLGAMKISACGASLALCFGLTLLRYLAIVCNKKYSKLFWTRYIVCSLLAVVMLGFGPLILQIPTFYIVRPMRVICFADWSTREPVALVFIAFCLICVGLPIAFMMYAYPAMYVQVASTTDTFTKSVQRPSVSGTSVTTSGFGKYKSFTVGEWTKVGSTTPSKTQHQQRMKDEMEEVVQKKRFLFQSMALVATLLTAMTPMTCMIMYEIVTGRRVSGEWDFACLAFYGVNPVISPIVIYSFGGINRRAV